ncbi:MAG: gamma-glutamyltransferase [Deltaproteobacteria bacterium]|nr:gamma-glutamyltransferase [Deltaproteobacteria bacterium]
MDRPAETRSYRCAVYSAGGICATSQPLATLAGVEIMRKGGSAADAAISMLNTLTVVEPFMNGPGGDLFGLYFDSARKELVGLNSSGPAPAGLSVETVLARGFTTMPQSGPLTITVPGALAGLAAFHERYGRLPWERLFEAALGYAEAGFPVTEVISCQWRRAVPFLREHGGSALLYLPDGRAPLPGEVFVNRPLGATLSTVAREGVESFYKGELGERICSAMACHGSPLSIGDLRSFVPEWVEPISTEYRGREVYELPPNCQGITVLQMLKILEDFDLEAMGLNSPDYIHLLVEAKKFAFFDRDTRLGDPRFIGQGWTRLVSDERIGRFKNWFNPDRASTVQTSQSPSDTVYVVAVDRERNVASFISSIFSHFGSGLVAGDTGIIMQNRGSLFSMDRGNPNCLEPGKRPLHTIIPAMVLGDGRPELAFGVMGGHMQPQGHVQILNDLYVFGLGVQEACDEPRFFHDGTELHLESSIPYRTRQKLLARGHRIREAVDVFGGFQGVWLEPSGGVLIGGSDPRKDGCAIGY